MQLDNAQKQDVLFLHFVVLHSLCAGQIFPFLHFYPLFPLFYLLFCPIVFQSALLTSNSLICSISTHYILIPLCCLLFYFSLFCSIHFFPNILFSELFYLIASSCVPYCSLFCSALFHIILSGLFHSLQILFCSTSAILPPSYLFNFPHFVKGQSSYVHFFPAPFAFYPGLVCAIAMVILDRLDPFCPAAHPSCADGPECFHSLGCVI